MESKIFLVIIIICVALILFGIVKHRYDLVVNFGLRIVAGLVGVYVLNTLFHNFGLGLEVGTNSYTALIIGLLGLPGFIAVYGIAAYFYFV